MQALRIVALKPNGPVHKKAVNRRRDELKSIRTQLSKISADEKKRAQELWDEHKEFFVDARKKDTETRVTVVPESIEEFFDP